MPPMSRANYRWELSSACFTPFAMACVEGGVIGVIAKKTFDAPDAVIAALSAAPAMANITGFFWIRLLRGRDRVRAVVVTQLLWMLCVALIAAAPVNTLGLAMLVILAICARSALAGLYNARSELWRANYARQARAHVTGRLTIVHSLVSGLAGLAIAWGMDMYAEQAPWTFRPLYLAAAALGLIGAWCFSNVRWRARASILAEERTPGSESARAGAGTMISVLKNDAAYRRFMSAQFVLGMAQLAGTAPFVSAVAEMMDYSAAIALTHVIPILMPIVSIPMWSRLLDRMHIVNFRVYHTWVFVIANVITCAALLLGAGGALALAIPLLYLSRGVVGVGFGGGRLAWAIGHHDFAPPHLANVYTGIHVTLTGVRGAIAPFIGVFLYSGWDFRVGDVHLAWEGLGGWVFGIFALVNIVAARMFSRLRDDMERGDVRSALDAGEHGFSR